MIQRTRPETKKTDAATLRQIRRRALETNFRADAEIARRKAAAAAPPAIPHPSDHIAHIKPERFDAGRFDLHRKAVAYMTKANARGLQPTYAQALTAVTRQSVR